VGLTSEEIKGSVQMAEPVKRRTPEGASSEGRLGRKPTKETAQGSSQQANKTVSPQEKQSTDHSYGSSGYQGREATKEGTKAKGKGGKKGGSKTPGNTTPRKIETPQGSNYLGKNFDPNYVPWARGNQTKGKGKEKGKEKKRKRCPSLASTLAKNAVRSRLAKIITGNTPLGKFTPRKQH